MRGFSDPILASEGKKYHTINIFLYILTAQCPVKLLKAFQSEECVYEKNLRWKCDRKGLKYPGYWGSIPKAEAHIIFNRIHWNFTL